MARDLGPKCRMCRREGVKLFLKGERCLTEKCAIERRSYPPGEHGRGRIKQSEYLLQLREKQKARRDVRPAREAVPHVLREGEPRHGQHRREPPPDARDASRQRRLPARLRRLPGPGEAAGPTRPLQRQRPPRQHPELRRQAERHRHAPPGSPVESLVRDATDLTASVAPWLQADHDGLTGKVLKWPERVEIDTPVQESLIVELYSK